MEPTQIGNSMSKYVKQLSNDELLQRMAQDLVEMHEQTAIDLGYWETALEVVERFYNVFVDVTISGKKIDNA